MFQGNRRKELQVKQPLQCAFITFYYFITPPPPKKVGKYNRMFDGNIGCSDTCYYVRPAQSDSDAILILPAKKRIKPLPILSDLGSF